ncbi:hypothetical protein ACWZHB_01275 [Nocardia sp. FBN12]|uniref:hypothetical protein n=1 Tax=Nocardia sp. FBN12 TaxID=3419766 RepID=UPI003D08007C
MVNVVVDTINPVTVMIRHRDGRTSTVAITEADTGVTFDIAPADALAMTIRLNGRELRVPTSPTLDAALMQFLAAWGNTSLAEQIGGLCTQSEIWPLLNLFEKAEMPDVAQAWSDAEESGRADDDDDVDTSAYL